LLNKLEALSSNPSTGKRKEKKTGRKERRKEGW
jgi:hypothetical protein